jgi:hypothetical protein
MRTMLLIAFTMFMMAGCTVETDDLEEPTDDMTLPVSEMGDGFGAAAPQGSPPDTEQPQRCFTDDDCENENATFTCINHFCELTEEEPDAP